MCYPNPPTVIVKNFKDIVNIEIKEITPPFIREYLKEQSKDIEFPVSINDISIYMLSKKKWFLEVVKYCENSGEDYNLIRNLPLGLTLNKDIYRVGVNRLVDDNPNLKLFQNMEYIFLDTDLVNLVKNSDRLPSSWLLPTLKNKLIILKKHWEKLDLNREWIKELIENIVSDRDELNEALSKIEQLPIVYQQNGEFTTLDSEISNFPPIMIRDEDRNNIKYFEIIEMNTIHIDYMDIYKPLLEQKFITKFSSKTLG